MAADPSKLSYFSLPGEIRNKIMNLVLVPGDVYPHTPVPNGAKRVPVSAANVQCRSGVQLIATCRQAYDEGHALFYSSNTFHLPANMTFEWSDRIQPKHKGLIKRIGITVGPNELDASMISHIVKTYMNLVLETSEFYAIKTAVSITTQKAWSPKMRYMAAWSSLEEIRLCLFKATNIPTTPLRYRYILQPHERTLKHHELVANVEDLEAWWHSSFWREMSRWPTALTAVNIITIIASDAEETWDEAIEWLYVRKPDEMAEGFWKYISGAKEHFGW